MSLLFAALAGLSVVRLEFMCYDANEYVLVQRVKTTTTQKQTVCYEEYWHKTADRLIYRVRSTCNCPIRLK